MTFGTFASWAELTNHVGAGLPLWYKAPMDHQPVRVQAHMRGDGCVRVYPPSRDADAFTADAKHLDRFRREAL